MQFAFSRLVYRSGPAIREQCIQNKKSGRSFHLVSLVQKQAVLYGGLLTPFYQSTESPKDCPKPPRYRNALELGLP